MGCHGSVLSKSEYLARKSAYEPGYKADKKPYQSTFERWIKSIYSNENLYKKYQLMCIPNYQVNQQNKVSTILKYWGKYSFKENFRYAEPQDYRYYKKHDILSARVYGKFMELIETLQRGEYKFDKTIQNQRVLSLLKKLRFSYDRYFFMKDQEPVDWQVTYPNRGQTKRQPSMQNRSQVQGLLQNQQEIATQVIKTLAQSSLYMVSRMYHFMMDIQLISLTQKRQVKNVFILNLQRIKTKKQKKLYCDSMKFNIFQRLVKAGQQKTPIQKMSFLEEEMPNYYFYKTKFKCSHNYKIMDKYEQLLLKTAECIQLLFPNHFQSKQNAKSSPLGYIEKRLFLADEQVGLFLLISTFVYLNCIGITLDLQNFRFKAQDESILTNSFRKLYTNHRVFMRILSSLSITGFREIAVRLLKFLDQCYSSKILPISQQELSQLKIYSNRAQAKQACFLEQHNFPTQHKVFKKLRQSNDQQEDKDMINQSSFNSIPQVEESRQVIQEYEQKTSQKNRDHKQIYLQNKNQSPVFCNQPGPQMSMPTYKPSSCKIQIDSKLPKKLQMMAKRINFNEDIMTKINKYILGVFTQPQQHSIFYLLEKWGNQNLDFAKIGQIIKKQYHSFYIKCDVLSARVYARAIQLISRLKETKEKDNIQQENYELLKQLRKKNEIDFSYDRFFFQNKYGPDRSDKSKTTRLLLKLIMESKMQRLKTFFTFMQDIKLISIDQKYSIGNVFMRRLQKIQDGQKKSLYFESIQFKQLQTIVQIYKSEGSPQKKENSITQTLGIGFPNYFCYRQEIYKGKKRLHSLYRSYSTLEQRHDYIQWMFPNHYQSAYNSEALPMNYLEKRLFLDEQMGLKMLISIYIFFDFLGIRLDLNTFQLSMCDRGRFYSAIVVHTHNHLRLMRILACLSIVGFRSIALKLIAFLDENTKKGMIGQRQRYQFEKNWLIYGEERQGVAKASAKTMCFLENENFPQKHCILNKLAHKQQNQPLLMNIDSDLGPNKEPPKQPQEAVNMSQKQNGYGLEIQIMTIPQKSIPDPISSAS